MVKFKLKNQVRNDEDFKELWQKSTLLKCMIPGAKWVLAGIALLLACWGGMNVSAFIVRGLLAGCCVVISMFWLSVSVLSCFEVDEDSEETCETENDIKDTEDGE